MSNLGPSSWYVDSHEPASVSRRFDQCTETCTTDCGHCKGRPVEALRADNERLARRLAGRFEEAEKLRAEVAALRQQLDEARSERDHERHRADTCAQLTIEAQFARDRLLVVYRAAEAWRRELEPIAAGEPDETDGQAFSALIAAIDAYRAGAPAEAPDGERA